MRSGPDEDNPFFKCRSPSRVCLDEEWYEPLRPFHVAGVVLAELGQQGFLFHSDPVAVGEAEDSEQDQQSSQGLHSQTQSDERDQDARIGWVSDQTIRTPRHNSVVRGHPDSQREEPSQDRYRPLPDQNAEQHQENSGIEDPIRQYSDAAVSEA